MHDQRIEGQENAAGKRLQGQAGTLCTGSQVPAEDRPCAQEIQSLGRLQGQREMTTKTFEKVPETTGLEEIHCSTEGCGKFLGYANIENGLIIIKCHNCKNSNINFSFSEAQTQLTASEVRCPVCDRFLYSAAVTAGNVAVKCRTCGNWHVLKV